jgi:hypothetical protein
MSAVMAFNNLQDSSFMGKFFVFVIAIETLEHTYQDYAHI